MFNQPKESQYATFDNIQMILDSYFCEKEEQIRANVYSEVQRMISNGEITL